MGLLMLKSVIIMCKKVFYFIVCIRKIIFLMLMKFVLFMNLLNVLNMFKVRGF